MFSLLYYLILGRANFINKLFISSHLEVPCLSRGLELNLTSTSESPNPGELVGGITLFESLVGFTTVFTYKRQRGGMVLDPRSILHGGLKEEGVKFFFSLRGRGRRSKYYTSSFFYNFYFFFNKFWVYDQCGWDELGKVAPIPTYPYVYANYWDKKSFLSVHFPVFDFKPIYKLGGDFVGHLVLRFWFSKVSGLGNRDEGGGINRLLIYLIFLTYFKLNWLVVTETRITNSYFSNKGQDSEVSLKKN